ncbi:MAG TPA: DUF1732 domain-containing protein [Bdellovibrionota bacterium]|jgi:uncharacterized protein (TIGR00255 family)|nr:DUF1732 domain-containing protein [Bdellovibrionota bacterium]
MNTLTSMTGFAAGEMKVGSRTFKVQLKSVNHRFFEFRWRAPRELFAAENTMRALAKQILRRGSLDILIEEEKVSAQDQSIDAYVNSLLDLDSQLPNRMHNQMSLYERFDILIRNADLWRNNATVVNEEVTPEAVSRAFESLLQSLDQDRKREGAALAAQLKTIHAHLSKYLEKIAAELPNVTKEWETTLYAKYEALTSEKNLTIPEERIAQEILMIAERRDVAEEIARTKVHLGHLEEILKAPPLDTGKKLDFLCQELHREWTTLSNKIQNQGLARVTMDAKLEVEKLREQAQNFV